MKVLAVAATAMLPVLAACSDSKPASPDVPSSQAPTQNVSHGPFFPEAPVTRPSSATPSANISSTSWPMGTLMPASWYQCAIGSPHASTRNRQSPSQVAATQAP